MPAAERWQRLRELLRELAQVRRDDHRAARLQIEQERWELESERLEREETERQIKEIQGRSRAAAWAAMQLEASAKEFGWSAARKEAEAAMFEAQLDLPRGIFTGKRGRSSEVKRSKSESNRVQPEQVDGAEAEQRSS